MTALVIGAFVVAVAAPAGAQEDPTYPEATVGGTVVEQPAGTPQAGGGASTGGTRVGGGGTLPLTGSDIMTLALIGAGAIAVGAVFAVAARRR
ncbi:MAG TPA: LPXTG cell wall anchor domain-containing protein, partial [Acidimicrobiia bacterium]|nr:LPXTG cell wall anchor domain-containing protein [Acidimicrobiia bacterium]